MKTGARLRHLLDPLGSAQLIGDQHHVQALSHLGLPRSPCRRSAESCEGRGPSGAPGPSPSRHRADPGSRESQCCLTIETSGQLWPVSPNGSASSAMVCSAASSRLRRRVEPATAIAGTLTQLYRSNPVVASVNCFIPQPMRTNPPPRRAELRERLSGGANCLLVGFLGDIRPFKNPEALAYLPHQDSIGREI